MNKMHRFLVIILLPWSMAGQTKIRSGKDFLVDKSKPYVYLEVDHLGPRDPLREGESAIGIWLRIHNNCILPITVSTFGVPAGSGAVGVLDNVVDNEKAVMGDGSVSYSLPLPSSPPLMLPETRATSTVSVASTSRKQEPTMDKPSGYAFSVTSTATLLPGRSLYFSIPFNHVAAQWHAQIPFQFAIRVHSALRSPSSFVSLYEEDLPKQNAR